MARTSSTAKKTTRTRKPATKTPPRLTLTKAAPSRPTLKHRDRPFMTDTQGFAVLTARLAGIPTRRINDWRDHRDGTCTRPLHDGSTLHYTHTTRTLRWQAICPMGAIHQYVIDSPSAAVAARVHADRCRTPHADFAHLPPLTTEELADLGILHTAAWSRTLPGDHPITHTIPVIPAQRGGDHDKEDPRP